MATWKSILCGVDGSSKSMDALRYADSLARDVEAQLMLLHVDPRPRGESTCARDARRRGRSGKVRETRVT